MEFAVVIERGPTSYGAYVPDLPGCAAVARSESDVRRLIREGIHIHLDEMRMDGEAIPSPTRTWNTWLFLKQPRQRRTH